MDAINFGFVLPFGVARTAAEAVYATAMRSDGLLATAMNEGGRFIELPPDHVRQMCDYARRDRPSQSPSDIVIEGNTVGQDRK